MNLISLMMTAVGVEGGEGVIGHLAGSFGVEWKLVAAQVVNFLLVAYFIYRFAVKPVLKTLDERQHKIADGLKFAEEMQEKLKEAERQHQEVLKGAAVEAKQVLDEAREQARVYTEKEAQEAVKKAEGILRKAEETIRLEKDEMMREVRKEVATLVVETTQKVLGKGMEEGARKRFGELATEELKEGK